MTREWPASVVGVVVVVGLVAACTSDDAEAPDRSPVAAPSSTATEPTRPPATRADPAQTPRRSRSPETRDELSAAEQANVDRQLIAAAWEGDVARARRLIARGADVNAQDDTQQSAFLIASSEGFYELLELTLRSGADVDAKDSFDGTALIRAAERGHWDVTGRLIQAGVALDHVNNLGWTALLEAIILGGTPRHVDTVHVLVAAGADVRLPSERDGVTPLEHATSRGQTPVAVLLRAADRADGGPGTSRAAAGWRLLRAAEAGDAHEAALALRAGARLEVRDGQQRTPLLLAAAADRLAVARLLVASGADPDALDARHDTPWLVTGVTGSVPMLETLLPAGPDLTIRNRFGGVSLIPASERGHVDYVRRVLETPIDVNHVNDLGWTALLEAVILGDGSRPYQQIVRILLDAGADPGIPDSNGTTALEHAEASGQGAVVRLLRRSS